MARRYHEIKGLAEFTAKTIVSDEEQWKKFLHTAGHTYSTPSTDRSEEDVLEGFTVFVMNYMPKEGNIYTIDSLPQTAVGNGTFHISVDDVYIGFTDVDLTWEDFQIVLNSLRK